MLLHLRVRALLRFPQSDSLSNHREVSSLHVDLPEVGPLRPSVFSLMHEELEAWSGVKLKDIAAYGIRVRAWLGCRKR